MLALTFTRYHILASLERIFNTRLKNCRLLFSAVISEHFSKNRMIISVVAAKIWYLKNVRFLLGHPVYLGNGARQKYSYKGRLTANRMSLYRTTWFVMPWMTLKDHCSHCKPFSSEYLNKKFSYRWGPACRGHITLEVIGNDASQPNTYDFLLMFDGNCGSILHRFWHISFRKILLALNPEQRPLNVIEAGTIR